jgi:septal ring factor EnvC (AmiA/AmiB activator)
MKARLPVLIMITLLLPLGADARDVQAEIRQIQQEREHLKAVRQQLEARMGALGKELKLVDTSLAGARRQTAEAIADVRRTDRRISELETRRRRLQSRVKGLKADMAGEAAAAYLEAGRPPLWLDVMYGADVTEIPHRQYLLARLVALQSERRRVYMKSVADLADVMTQLSAQRAALIKLKENKVAKQRELEERVRAKRKLLQKVRQDSSLQRERDIALARQEKALRRLLQGFGSTLLASDTAASWQPVRELKGRLPWPLDGSITARFGSRPWPGRPKLSGVQLAPRSSNRQVKAVAPGQVRFADWFGGYGLMLIIDHGDGLMSVYAHNDALFQNLGDWVDAGEVLASAGSTGWVQDVALYFEVRDKGKAVNPVRWCRKQIHAE